MAGIKESLEVLKALDILVDPVVGALRAKSAFGKVVALWGLMDHIHEFKDAVEDVDKLLAEWKDLDGNEAKVLVDKLRSIIERASK